MHTGDEYYRQELKREFGTERPWKIEEGTYNGTGALFFHYDRLTIVSYEDAEHSTRYFYGLSNPPGIQSNGWVIQSEHFYELCSVARSLKDISLHLNRLLSEMPEAKPLLYSDRYYDESREIQDRLDKERANGGDAEGSDEGC